MKLSYELEDFKNYELILNELIILTSELLT